MPDELKKRKKKEFNDSLKRPNLKIMGIEEELQTKGICNIFNKIITLKRLDQNRTTTQHIIIKTTSTEFRERIWKVV
jgi:hypothetical protein